MLGQKQAHRNNKANFQPNASFNSTFYKPPETAHSGERETLMNTTRQNASMMTKRDLFEEEK